MFKKYYKILLVFSSFFAFGIILFNAYQITNPLENIPEFFPDQKILFKDISFEETKPNELEIYKIIEPQKNKNPINVNNNSDSLVKINDLDLKFDDNNLNYRVQISSIRDKKKIMLIYNGLQKKYFNYFESKEPFVEEINIPGKGFFYRIKSLELYSKDMANRICEDLKNNNNDCIVSRNK